jgi:hypothetical protein
MRFHRMQVEIELALHAAEAADIDDTAEYAGRRLIERDVVTLTHEQIFRCDVHHRRRLM